MIRVDEFFGHWEKTVEGWQATRRAIEDILDNAGTGRQLAWRGISNASYPLHSSLYRRLLENRGKVPDERDLIRAEKKILDAARKRWRFDNLPALEIMAHLQHYGGPTRLLDVSLNPMIALWFAVEKNTKTDARLLVFDVTRTHIRLDSNWGGYDLPWEHYTSDNWPPSKKWRQDLPRLWKPPNYNQRIPAQNSAFLIGGVPKTFPGSNAYWRRPSNGDNSSKTWKISEIREATSIIVRMVTIERKLRPDSTPTFTLRIRAEGKSEIKERLEHSYGFDASSIYPDHYGLASYAIDNLI